MVHFRKCGNYILTSTKYQQNNLINKIIYNCFNNLTNKIIEDNINIIDLR